jgi:hypothetical protein
MTSLAPLAAWNVVPTLMKSRGSWPTARYAPIQKPWKRSTMTTGRSDAGNLARCGGDAASEVLIGPRIVPHHQAPMSSFDAQDASLSIAAATLIVDTVTVEVAKHLRREGIRCILLRGAAIASRFYSSPAERRYVDVDFLVGPSDYASAEATLASLGFVESALERSFPRDRPRHAHTWSRERPPVSVDLHRTLIGLRRPPEEVWDVFTSSCESIHVLQTQVEVPSPAAEAVVIALHAAHHGHDLPGTLDDLSRLLSQLSEEAWRAAVTLAERLDATSMFALGLRLVPAGSVLADRLGLPADAPRDPSLLGGRAFHIAQGLDWLGQKQGAHRKVAFLARKIFPEPRQMRVLSPLARRGPVGLTAAYVGRLGLLAVWAVPALAVLLRRRVGRLR